ncbi:hypothetical protein ACYOEI_30660, partial [Singulisphaera rosea]
MAGMESFLSSGGGMHIGCTRGVAIVGVVLGSLWACRGSMGAEQVRPVPLGGALDRQVGDRTFGVYVPTRY